MICMVNRNLGKGLAIALGVLGAGNVLTPVTSAGLFDATTSTTTSTTTSNKNNLNDVLNQIINSDELNKCDTFKKKLDLLKKVINLLKKCIKNYNSKNYREEDIKKVYSMFMDSLFSETKENIEKVHSMFMDSLLSATNATIPEFYDATGYLYKFSVIIGNNKENEILRKALRLLNVKLAKERMPQITPGELKEFVDKYGFRP